MKTLIETLCGKLEDWDMDPITLAKAIGIFLVFVIIIAIYPVLFITLLYTIVCVLLIILIYVMIE